ncbi:MAG: A/G-specific adenine glycosylase [Methylophilaceae bacterium]
MEVLKKPAFNISIIKWHKKFGRHDLPWQKSKDPYHVWVSEIMLQQTQVVTVISYYQKFITKFKTIKALAQASEDLVLSMWSGLGFYSRARNLHAASIMIMKEYSGHFPDNFQDMIKLPGIGRSTAGAILAFCFNKPYPILDGNVKRVLSRVYGITTPINNSSTEKKLWLISEKNLPKKNIDIYTQAIMDFGATLCIPKRPICNICPITQSCVAYVNGLATQIPKKNPVKKNEIKKTHFYIYEYQKQVFLVKNRSGVWNGLWLPPNEEIELKNKQIIKYGHRQSVFSHYKLVFEYTFIKALAKPEIKLKGLWINWQDIQDIGLPAPIKKLLIELSP